jgi:hypothetical protein
MSTRWDNFAAAEQATADYLRQLGNEPLNFGAAQLSERARELQRLDESTTPDLMRWLADNLVRTVSGEVVYVDAKFALPRRANFSIEMRSMLCARLQTRRVFYVCSRMGSNDDFYAFRAIASTDVPRSRPCCGSCQMTYLLNDVAAANVQLPKYCAQQRKGEASGTPYFVIDNDADGWWHPNPLGIPSPGERASSDRFHCDCHPGAPVCRFGFGLMCLNLDACENPHHDRRPYRSQLLIGSNEDLHETVRKDRV